MNPLERQHLEFYYAARSAGLNLDARDVAIAQAADRARLAVLDEIWIRIRASKSPMMSTGFLDYDAEVRGRAKEGNHGT